MNYKFGETAHLLHLPAHLLHAIRVVRKNMVPLPQKGKTRTPLIQSRAAKETRSF
jgi:hypothetical protein